MRYAIVKLDALFLEGLLLTRKQDKDNKISFKVDANNYKEASLRILDLLGVEIDIKEED